jgi:hypothetical protein
MKAFKHQHIDQMDMMMWGCGCMCMMHMNKDTAVFDAHENI